LESQLAAEQSAHLYTKEELAKARPYVARSVQLEAELRSEKAETAAAAAAPAAAPIKELSGSARTAAAFFQQFPGGRS